jgi:hypothetical protein
MDEIMLRSFCAGSTLSAVLDRDDVSPMLAQVNAELDIALQTKTRGPVDMDYVDPAHLGYDTVLDWATVILILLLDETLLLALYKIHPSQIEDMSKFWTIPLSVAMVSGHHVCGAHFTTKAASQSASKASSIIYFKPSDSDEPIPGQIQSVFSVPFKGRTTSRLYHFFAVRRYKSRTSESSESFSTKFTGLGALIYSQQLSEEVEIIRSSMVTSHAWQRSHDDGHVIMKSYNRVSSRILVLNS